MVLNEATGKKRQWVFDTPRGSFEVLSRAENPVWRKPDWAFVEDGEPIPTNPADRLDYGSLGEYALYFGNGYMIHGTLYERLLGRAVSHGCIRVGRDDLRKVWAAAQTRHAHLHLLMTPRASVVAPPRVSVRPEVLEGRTDVLLAPAGSQKDGRTRPFGSCLDRRSAGVAVAAHA